MKEEKISIIIDIVVGIVTILVLGCVILMIPYKKAADRDAKEAVIIYDYLEEQKNADVPNLGEDAADNLPATDAESQSGIAGNIDNSKGTTVKKEPYYKGTIDSILVIEKINLEKAIIRGTENDYNLSRYLFVTADQTSVLGVDNYVIYGHCSQTYGHSFNRLEELAVGDSFQLIQGEVTYDYTVTSIQLELRDNAAPLLVTGSNTVQLVSCEKKLVDGYPEKRLIVVTAEKSDS